MQWLRSFAANSVAQDDNVLLFCLKHNVERFDGDADREIGAPQKPHRRKPMPRWSML